MDALDGSQGMLDQAKERNIYKKYICELCTDKKIAAVADGTLKVHMSSS